MKDLYRQYGTRVALVEVLIRQAHPGERHGAYHTYDQKFQDARDYRDEEAIPWPVLVDDLSCTVQRVYGGLAAAAYLIDSRGRVAFCGTWGQGPALGRRSTTCSLAAVQGFRLGEAPTAVPISPPP